MSFYLSQVLAFFFLPAVLFGLVWSGATHPRYKARFCWSVLAILAGGLGYAFMPYRQIYILSLSALYVAALVVLSVGALFWRRQGGALLLAQSVILALGGFMWAKSAKLSMLSATSVINTDLVVNLAALITGFILIIACHFFSERLFAERSRLLKVSCFIAFLVLALLPLSGELLLALMKLQWLGLHHALLSYVSRVTNFYWLYAYLVALICLVPATALYRSRISPLKKAVRAMPRSIARRKKQAQLNHQHRLLGSFLCALLVTLASLVYWDAVASQPPTRSAALPVKLATDGAVHITVTDELKDGKLHRYQWVASDGKVVRFFIIDRYPGEMKFGVVFDACMLCGDAGYIQSGDQVICLACGVHIFIPSIGNSGGCNPIPIPAWTLKNGVISISHKNLETGLQYFSDVVKITVTDPVNGKALTNIGAPYSYEFGGKTYFFTSQTSYQAFRDDPWQYVKQSSALSGGH